MERYLNAKLLTCLIRPKPQPGRPVSSAGRGPKHFILQPATSGKNMERWHTQHYILKNFINRNISDGLRDTYALWLIGDEDHKKDPTAAREVHVARSSRMESEIHFVVADISTYCNSIANGTQFK